MCYSFRPVPVHVVYPVFFFKRVIVDGFTPIFRCSVLISAKSRPARYSRLFALGHAVMPHLIVSTQALRYVGEAIFA